MAVLHSSLSRYNGCYWYFSSLWFFVCHIVLCSKWNSCVVFQVHVNKTGKHQNQKHQQFGTHLHRLDQFVFISAQTRRWICTWYEMRTEDKLGISLKKLEAYNNGCKPLPLEMTDVTAMNVAKWVSFERRHCASGAKQFLQKWLTDQSWSLCRCILKPEFHDKLVLDTLDV